MMNIQFPRLKKCCCCLPLRVGSLIIGYSSIVVSFLFLSVVSFSLYKVITYVETHEDVPDAEHTPEDIKRIGQSLYITHAYLILVYLYYLIINLFLVIGIHMNKTLYMKTYFNSGLFLILEVLVGKNSPFGAWLVDGKPVTDNLYVVYYAFCTLLLNETILLLFMLHLAVGVCSSKTHLLEHYLICRFITWVIELITLFLLCLLHKLLIGYYLAILFFVILEFYSFIVVYSFYVHLQEDEKDL